MWLLQDSDGRIIYLELGKEIVVGRKRCDIILDNDESISRTHASFTIRPKETVAPNEPISECCIREKGSKYGTYVINEDGKVKLSTEDHLLKDQDKIKFGLQKYIFTVKYIPMITVTSALQKRHREQLNQILDEIDGMILNHWVDDCTHLTVSEGTLTQKVVLALASAKPIVTVKYWEAVKRAVDDNDDLPKSSDFTAPPGELLNRGKVSFVPNENRKVLFSGKIFIHFTESQFKDYEKIIKFAGGKSVMYKAGKLPIQSLYAENIIVLQYPISDVTQSTIHVVPEYNEICQTLEKKKLRMIPDNEIALAILHCSIEKFCNSRFRFSNFLKNTNRTEVKKSSTLVIDTQDLTTSQENSAKPSKRTSKHYIPETMDEFSQQRNKKTSTDSSKNISLNKNHYIPDSEEFSLQEKVSKVHTEASQGGHEKQKNGKIIPETLDFSTESSREINQVLYKDNPNIVINIFSQSSTSESSSQTKQLLPNPVNPLIESRNIHKTIKGTIESQGFRKEPECLIINDSEEPSEEKSRHVVQSTNKRVVVCESKRVSEKPQENILDSRKLKTLVNQLSGEKGEKKKYEVNVEMKRKPKIVMLSDDDDLVAVPVSQKKVSEVFEPTSKRLKKHSDTHAHDCNQTLTEVPLRKTSFNPCKVFKKTHVNLPRKRITFQELEVYDRTKGIF